MPTASIIIPCYNAERHLEETISSARAQTIRDIEIICVDDGSTDATPQILERIAREDSRIRVLRQENAGEGPARNAGLESSTGSWLYFLDSDDLMEPNLLERAIETCVWSNADLVVFRTLMLDEQTGEERLCDWSFKRDWVPDDSFCPADHPQRIFNSFQNWVHNKLFRGSFVRDHGLRMQHVHRTADLLFTCRALSEASCVALLDEPLHRYRVNNPQSAMATSDSYPLDFYKGFLALRTALEKAGTWELYHDSFVNWAIEGVSINLRVARSYEGYTTIACAMARGGFERLDILGFPREKADLPWCYDHVHALATQSFEESLFWQVRFLHDKQAQIENDASYTRLEIERLRGIIADRDDMIADRDSLIHDVMNSKSFKIGRCLSALPRKVRDLLRGVN